MHLYLTYQSSSTYDSKDIAQVKVFQNYVKVQDQGHKVKSHTCELSVMTKLEILNFSAGVWV
jgi:hypothetical protein